MDQQRIRTLNKRISIKEESKIISVNELMKKMRNLNEIDSITKIDQENEEKKFNNFFDDLNVIIDYEDLEIGDNYVFWGGTIDGMIQFVYKVTPLEQTSGIEYNYLEGFSKDNPDNEEIIDRIDLYYNKFFKYWRDNKIKT